MISKKNSQEEGLVSNKLISLENKQYKILMAGDKMKIPFNKPFLTGNELEYIQQAVASGKISGDGMFTKKCHDFFERKFGFRKVLLTTSCTDALEMAAILINIQPGDEVIMPAFTFVSTANAFVLRGAKIIFADSGSENPNMDTKNLVNLITEKTKSIVAVHYAGIACNMDEIMQLADKYKLFVIEDAAQGIDSYHNGQALGSIGHLAAFSFHETKNIISGEGGMLVINDKIFIDRAEIIREKGTNRSQFFRGETDKYGWIDIGSSFLPSDIIAAFLFAQLENLDAIQEKRLLLWKHYFEKISSFARFHDIGLPIIPSFATNNAHMFYIVCKNIEQRTDLINYLKKHGILSVFHYLSLHRSPYYINKYAGEGLPNADKYSDCLLRLPMYYELGLEEIDEITGLIKMFLEDNKF